MLYEHHRGHLGVHFMDAQAYQHGERNYRLRCLERCRLLQRHTLSTNLYTRGGHVSVAINGPVLLNVDRCKATTGTYYTATYVELHFVASLERFAPISPVLVLMLYRPFGPTLQGLCHTLFGLLEPPRIKTGSLECWCQ